MKTINEYIAGTINDTINDTITNVKCTLTEHLLKTRTSNSTQSDTGGMYNITLPIVSHKQNSSPDSNDVIYSGKTNKIQCGGPFVIYIDAYRGKTPHIAYVPDMIFSIAAEDPTIFESFSNSSIIGSFSTLKETVAFALKTYFNYSDAVIDRIVDGKQTLEYRDYPKGGNASICDSWNFLCDAINGDLTDGAYMTDVENYIGKFDYDISADEILEFMNDYYYNIEYKN